MNELEQLRAMAHAFDDVVRLYEEYEREHNSAHAKLLTVLRECMQLMNDGDYELARIVLRGAIDAVVVVSRDTANPRTT